MKKIKKLPVWDLTDFYEFPESESLKRDIDKIEIRTKRFYKNFKGKLRKLSDKELLYSLKEFESIEEFFFYLHNNMQGKEIALVVRDYDLTNEWVGYPFEHTITVEDLESNIQIPATHSNKVL